MSLNVSKNRRRSDAARKIGRALLLLAYLCPTLGLPVGTGNGLAAGGGCQCGDKLKSSGKCCCKTGKAGGCCATAVAKTLSQSTPMKTCCLKKKQAVITGSTLEKTSPAPPRENRAGMLVCSCGGSQIPGLLFVSDPQISGLSDCALPQSDHCEYLPVRTDSLLDSAISPEIPPPKQRLA